MLYVYEFPAFCCKVQARCATRGKSRVYTVLNKWHGEQAKHPRRVSLLLHPHKGGSAPLLLRDWPRREQRRACIKLMLQQRIEVRLPQALPSEKAGPPRILTRAERTHSRLDWQSRLVRNQRQPEAEPPTITLHGVPDHFAGFLSLKAEEACCSDLRKPCAPTSLLVRVAPHALILTDSTGCATRKEERCL